MVEQTSAARSRLSVANVLAAGLDLVWLYALLSVLVSGIGLDVSVSLLLLTYVVSFASTSLLRRVCQSSRWVAAISWTAWASVAVVLVLAGGDTLAVGPATFVVIASAVLWWLGDRAAGRPVTHKSVLARTLAGLVILACALLAGSLMGLDHADAVALVFVFVILALSAAAVTRTEEQGAPGPTGRSASWWVMLCAGLAAIVGVGLAIGALATPDFMSLILRGLRGIWGLIEQALRAVAGLAPSSCADSPDAYPLPTDALSDWGGGASSQGPGSQSSRVGGFIFIGIVLMSTVLLVGWLTVSSLLAWIRRADQDKAEMEYLRGGLRLDLSRLLDRLVACLRHLASFGRARSALDGEPTQSKSTRRLYAEMLRWGARAGWPRSPSQTPFEYQSVLCAALPAYGEDVTLITQTYVRARYGARPPTEEELQRVRESRGRLKRRAATIGARRSSGRESDRAEGNDSR